MTTTSPPASLLRVPRLTEVRAAMHVDRWVAIVAIVAGAAVIITGLIQMRYIVRDGGDVVAIAAAIATVLTPLANVLVRKRSEPTDKP